MRSTDTSNVRLVERVIVYGANGTAVRCQPGRLVSMVLCSVKRGAVDVFLGSNNVGLVPDLHFGQTNRPEWVPIPTGEYEFCLVASDPNQTTQASVIFGGPAGG